MRHSEGHVAMKRNPVQKRGSIHSEMGNLNGTQRINAQSWNLYNGRVNRDKNESIRVFPLLSNWTELDIWLYIHLENIEIVPLYLSAERPVVERNGTWIMVDDERMRLKPGETPEMKWVRFRTRLLSTHGCGGIKGNAANRRHTGNAAHQNLGTARSPDRL